jgi:nondiscriminating aspartyl-tRNA synthetase
MTLNYFEYITMIKQLKRTLIFDCLSKTGETVTVAGFVHTVRAHGKIAFLDLSDRTGLIQIGGFTPELAKQIADLGQQDVIEVTGKVKQREAQYINKNVSAGTIEIEAESLKILEKSAKMPFDMACKDLKLELPTLLDYRALTLRHEHIKKIFLIQAALAKEFRNAAIKLNCSEIFIPTIAAGATEGGAEVFTVDYFGHKAFMTQSPQLYKQIMVAVLERVFTIAKAYRAEPSVTTRHLTESTQMDIEIGFIHNFEELLDALEFVGIAMVGNVAKDYPDILKDFSVEKPLVPQKIPRLKLREAQSIITSRTGRDLSKELDLNPEDEIEICNWAKEKHQSDFVTITHFPTKKRAFYTMPDPANPEYSLSYDLLFRGLEILSGSKRINNYKQLITMMEKKGINPDTFGQYMMAFKFGMPPEGGFSFGLERLTMKLLELTNVREASLFPRDMERIDERFSKKEHQNNKH